MQCTIYVNSIHLLKRMIRSYICKSQNHMLISTSGEEAVAVVNHCSSCEQ